MNKQAEAHLAVAVGYIAKGDEFYAKAADEIIAAMAAEPLTYLEVGKRIGKSDTWVSRLVTQRRAFLRRNDPDETFTLDHERGSHATTAEIEQGVEKVLANLPVEQKAELIGSLTSQPDVIEHLASEPEKAEQVLHRPASDVWQRHDEQRGIDRTKRIVTSPPAGLTGMVAQWEILGYILQAVDMAIRTHNEKFLIGHLTDGIEQLEKAFASDNPEEVIEEFLNSLKQDVEDLRKAKGGE